MKNRGEVDAEQLALFAADLPIVFFVRRDDQRGAKSVERGLARGSRHAGVECVVRQQGLSTTGLGGDIADWLQKSIGAI